MAFTWNFGEALGDFFSGIPTAVSNFGNWIGDTFFGGSHETNEVNKEVAKENLEYEKWANEQNIAFTKQENDITRAREDTAVQRAAADMTAAGLSKTLAAGQPASAASLNPPQVQAPNNSFQMQKNLAGMNMMNFVSDLHFKRQENKRANELNDAQVKLIEEQAKNQSITNETLAERLANENALTMAKTEETNTFVEYYKVQTKVEEIIGKYKAESLEADIAKVYQDIAQSKKSMELTDAQIEKIYYESLNIAQDTLNKELAGKKTQKEIDLLAEDIVKAQLDALALKHDINYAQKYNYPVGTAPGGLLGSALGVGFSLGDRYKEDISSDNPSGLSKLIFNFTHPIWKWKF